MSELMANWMNPAGWALGALLIVLGGVVGYLLRRVSVRSTLLQAQEEAAKLQAEAQREAGAAGGVPVGPEGAACVAALRTLRERGAVDADERIVMFNTATALKYADMAAVDCPIVDPLPEQTG